METLILQPPHDMNLNAEQYMAGSVFLAGTIEMGTGENWQPKAIAALYGKVGAIYNPRREDWDSSWEQSIENPNFSAQVGWELDHIDRVLYTINGQGVVYFYFAPDSKSPVTLLELGLVAGHLDCRSSGAKAIVCCPKGFWRRGNIEIVCARNNIPLYEDFDASIDAVIKSLNT